MNSVRRARSTSSADGSQSFSGAGRVHAAAARARSRLFALELVRVVGADQVAPRRRGAAASSRSRSRWRGGAVVGGGDVLEDASAPAGRRAGVASCAVVEVGVAAVQQPAVAGR